MDMSFASRSAACRAGLLTSLAAAWLALAPLAAPAQDEPGGAENPAHVELRTLRDGLVEAVNAGDLERLLTFLHEDVIVTWLDGTQSRGHDQVREYYRSKTEGEGAIVASFGVNPEVRELSFLYGDDTAIAYGDAVSHFVLTTGQELDINGPWTASMVKGENGWLIAAFHSSAGLFDNPLLAKVERFAYWGIGIAAVVGLLLGAMLVIAARKLRGGKPAAAA
jgi:uncharacterized protein (TIGR02246 family)